jgi:predicted Zn-dependent peptidase
MFSVVGDFDEDEVRKAIEEEFGSWRNNTPWERITREYTDIPGGVITIETPDKENAVLLARMNLDSNQNDPDYAALYLADYMLGGGAGFDSRLTARIRVKEGLSYSVGSSVGGGLFDRAGSWTMQAIAAPQNIDKVQAALRDCAEPGAGRQAGWKAAVAPGHRPHLPHLGQAVRGAHARAHGRTGARRAAQVPRPGEAHHREGG